MMLHMHTQYIAFFVLTALLPITAGIGASQETSNMNPEGCTYNYCLKTAQNPETLLPVIKEIVLKQFASKTFPDHEHARNAYTAYLNQQTTKPTYIFFVVDEKTNYTITQMIDKLHPSHADQILETLYSMHSELHK